MKKTYLSFLLGVIFLGVLDCHAEYPFFWSAEIGRGTIDLKEQYYLNDYERRPETTVVATRFGYQFANRWQIGGEFSLAFSSVTMNLFDDNYGFGEWRGFVGYSLKLNDHFYLVPAIGVTDWYLSADEAILFRSDDETYSKKSVDGTDIYGQLNAEIPLSKRFSLSLGYSRTTTNVARVDATKLALIGRF